MKFREIYSIYMIFVGIGGNLLYYLQSYKIFKTKSAGDLTLIGFIVGFISVTSWLLYGIIIKDRAIIISSTLGCIGIALIISGILLYG